jgi:membrane protease subunit (stomatin/prohibitin family)
MGMVGQNMGQFMQYQTAQSIPTLAQAAGESGGGIAGGAMGLGAGVALGQVLAGNIAQGLGTGIATAAAASGEPPTVQDVMALIEKLGELKAKGILTEDEFAAKKTELLKKL